MKKNLITSLKKLYAAFGGKDPTKDNAVDIVDKIADSVDNMDYPTIEEVDDELYQNWKGDYTYLNWNKYYTTNTNSLFKNNSLYHIPIYFGIENEMIVADDWFEYMTTTPSSNNANQNILENMWYACHVGFNNANGLLLKQSIKDMTVSTFINRIKNNIEQMVNANKIILTTTSYMVVRNPITSNNCIIGTRYYNDVNKYHFDILCDNRSGLGHISADYNVSDGTTTYSINYGVNLKPGTQYAGKIVGIDEDGYYDYIEPVDTNDFATKEEIEDFITYEDWQKEDDEKNLYFPNGKEGFGAIPVLDINKTKYGDYIYIKETGTDTGLQTGWEEYMATSSTTASNLSNAERLFTVIKVTGIYKFIGNIDNKTALNNFATQLNTEIENLISSGYFIPVINKQMEFEIVSLGSGTSSTGLSFRNHIVFKYMKTSTNDIFFDITVQNYDRINRSCSIQYNPRANNVVSWRFNDMPTKVLNYNLDTLNKNTYFKYDEDGYFTLAPDNKAEKALVVTITENNNTFTADKTYTELYDAFLDRQIFCLYNGNYYSLTNASSTRIFFTDNSVNPTSITISSDNSITVVE